jgi:hypothetical protein
VEEEGSEAEGDGRPEWEGGGEVATTMIDERERERWGETWA